MLKSCAKASKTVLEKFSESNIFPNFWYRPHSLSRSGNLAITSSFVISSAWIFFLKVGFQVVLVDANVRTSVLDREEFGPPLKAVKMTLCHWRIEEIDLIDLAGNTLKISRHFPLTPTWTPLSRRRLKAETVCGFPREDRTSHESESSRQATCQNAFISPSFELNQRVTPCTPDSECLR